jgi:hypothetical protein
MTTRPTALKAAVLGALFCAYAAPSSVLQCGQTLRALLSASDKEGGALMVREAAEPSERALRTLLTLVVTAVSLLRVVSPELVVGGCSAS